MQVGLLGILVLQIIVSYRRRLNPIPHAGLPGRPAGPSGFGSRNIVIETRTKLFRDVHPTPRDRVSEQWGRATVYQGIGWTALVTAPAAETRFRRSGTWKTILVFRDRNCIVGWWPLEEGIRDRVIRIKLLWMGEYLDNCEFILSNVW